MDAGSREILYSILKTIKYYQAIYQMLLRHGDVTLLRIIRIDRSRPSDGPLLCLQKMQYEM